MVHDFPDEAKFLKPDERARVLRRLAEDKQASATHEDFKTEYLWQSLKDAKTWLFACVYMGADGSLYAFSLFVPSIINQLGYTSTRANLLSVPPYFVAAIVTVMAGWYADRTQRRGLTNIVISISGIVGFAMLLGSSTAGVKYAGVFLGAIGKSTHHNNVFFEPLLTVCSGIYPCIANTISWCSNNIEGVYKRGVTLGIVIG